VRCLSLFSLIHPDNLFQGVTVYRALKYSETSPGDWVVIPGAGGGLGHLGKFLNLTLECLSQSHSFIFSAVQYAKYMGRRVIAIDGGEEKHKLCKTLGADAWIDFTTSKDIVGDVKKATGGLGAHAAIVTTASVRRLSYQFVFVSSHL